MARKVIVELVDDIDGTIFGDGQGENIAFSVNGVDDEIDLKSKHANKFHKRIGYFIEYATRTGGRKRRSDRPVVPAVADVPVRRRGEVKEIRRGRPSRATISPPAAASPPRSSRRSATPTERPEE